MLLLAGFAKYFNQYCLPDDLGVCLDPLNLRIIGDLCTLALSSLKLRMVHDLLQTILINTNKSIISYKRKEQH